MLLNPFRLICSLVSLLTVLSIASLGCSYADGALFPSTYDLVRDTDAIVLAQATSNESSVVNFKIIEVLKGDFLGSELEGFESNNSCVSTSFPVDVKQSLPRDLRQKPHKIVPKYLLFLERKEGLWRLDSWATERVNDPIVDVAESHLVRNVRHFVRISSLNNYEREKQELKNLRQVARRSKDPKSYPEELIELIDNHFDSPSPKKSYKDLLDLYTRLPKEEKRQVLWAIANGQHPEAADFLSSLLNANIPLSYAGPISKYAAQTKNYDLLVRLGRNYPKLDKSSRWPIMWALIAIAEDQHKEIMLAALRSADKEEAAELADWFVRFPSDEAIEIVRRLVGTEYQENWELTFGLAGMGDVGTISWAEEFMRSDHEDRWMAFYTIAHSPLDKADELAKLVINGSDAKALASLIQGYEDSHSPYRTNRLRDIIALKDRIPDVSLWLVRTLESMESEGEKDAAELLATLKEQDSIQK